MAAARVAARYAAAPSYSQMLADEARNAMRVAKAAQKAAEQAHATAQMVLAGLEAVDAVEPERQCGHGNGSIHPDAPMLQKSPAPSAAGVDLASGTTAGTLPVSDNDQQSPHRWGEPFDWDQMTLRVRGDVVDESAAAERPHPVHDNVLQFPREMIATRRLRPRRIEGPLAQHESAPQLSIFEIDPETISTVPSSPVADELAPTWMRPEWPTPVIEPEPQEELIDEPVRERSRSTVVDLAPLGARLVANLVDGALNLAVCAGLIALAAHSSRLLRSPRAFEFCAMLLLLLVCAAYQALFSLTDVTPGMWFAGIGLCTLNGYKTQRAQRCRRLMALPLSVLPLGLGLAWSLFDEDHLTWHDRLSETYLRLR